MRALKCSGVRVPSSCLVAMLGSQSPLLGLAVPLPGDHREKQEDTAGTVLRDEAPRAHATGPQENSPPHLRLLTSPFSRVPPEKHVDSLKSWTVFGFCLLSLPSPRLGEADSRIQYSVSKLSDFPWFLLFFSLSAMFLTAVLDLLKYPKCCAFTS